MILSGVFRLSLSFVTVVSNPARERADPRKSGFPARTKGRVHVASMEDFFSESGLGNWDACL
jgi:hypothetical protein